MDLWDPIRVFILLGPLKWKWGKFPQLLISYLVVGDEKSETSTVNSSGFTKSGNLVGYGTEILFDFLIIQVQPKLVSPHSSYTRSYSLKQTALFFLGPTGQISRK